MKAILFILILAPFWGYSQFSNSSGDRKVIVTNQASNDEISNLKPPSDEYLGGDHKYIRIIQANNKERTGVQKENYVLSGNVIVDIGDAKLTCDSFIVDNVTFSLYFYGNIIVGVSDLQMRTTNLQINFSDRPRLVFNADVAQALGLKARATK
jgi:lipopolysaccharide assembly outer membrane protein LptD (OstA)